MAEGLRTADCDEPANADSVIETDDLGGGQSLVEVRCRRAAYRAAAYSSSCRQVCRTARVCCASRNRTRKAT
jgi:hypothetical protein